MLAALVFVLARNIVKLVVERRKALPFARFRAKLVALLLGMTLVPAVLVLIVGSELIRTNIDRWFNAPMADILSSANQIAERLLPASSRCSRPTTPAASRGAAGGGRSHQRRRPADPRPAGAGRDAAARPDGGGVPRRAVRADRCPASSRSSTSRRRRCRPVTAAPRSIASPRRRSAGRRRPARSKRLAPRGDLLHAAAVIRGPRRRKPPASWSRPST